MTVYLDQPLPDEILFSVVARYIEQEHIISTGLFLKRLIGCETRFDTSIEFSHLAAETARAWGMSADQIAARLTLLPFYSSLFPGASRIGVVRQVLRGTRWLGYLAPGRPRIRYCEACWREDDQSGDPRYWRRAHQLPGVAVCPWHGHVLFSASQPFAHRRMVSAARSVDGRPIATPSTREREAWQQVARLAYRQLCGENLWENLESSNRRMELAHRCGYLAVGGIDSRRMKEDLVVRLGEEYFDLFASKRSITIPLERAVLTDQEMGSPCCALWVDYLLTDISTRTIRDINPDCPGSRSHWDFNHCVVPWSSREGHPHYLCICGFSFFLTQGERGVSISPTQDGRDVALAIVMLTAKSYATSTLVAMLGVPPFMVDSARNRQIIIRDWDRTTERARRLVRWIDLVNHYGDPDIAYKKCAHKYHDIGRLANILPQAVTPKNGMIIDEHRRGRGER
ncbi:hypothetical protein BLA6860_02883 [Burkholderia lata]|nr:hypothetical protein BLA6860_02883 [Burkholderia lata]